jgi:phospho-N-acetylmuramoyl-pentapeptide-transferase
MLYYLFRFLEQFNIPGAHIWSYISFRALLALILSLLISAWFGEHFIKWMKRRNISETARDPNIDPFGVEKKGVPTMGGIIIIVAILVPVLLLGRMRNIYLLLMIITTVWLGFLGFMDDYIKIFRKNKEGLKGKYKIIGQVSIGFIVGITLWLSPDAVVREYIANPQQHQQQKEMVVKHKAENVKSLQTTIPFYKNHNLSYSDIMSFCGEYKVAAGWILFVLMTIFVVTAVSNGANLNDGMDGMCAGNSAIIGVALLIFAYVSSHIVYAAYFDIMHIPGSQELVVFLSAFVGAMIGFLWYNAYPAQVFMGDTGSLTIGGIIGVCAVIVHKELLLPILCGIFFVESLSVIIQTQWFKIQKRKGKRVRVFRATPIHDTFRKLDSQLDATSTYILKGWPHRPFHESKITVRFWITTIILVAITIITLKIR